MLSLAYQKVGRGEEVPGEVNSTINVWTASKENAASPCVDVFHVPGLVNNWPQ